MQSFFSYRSAVLLLSILTGFITTSFLARADETVSYNQEYLSMNTVEDMYVTYNSRVNGIFNSAINKVVRGQGTVEVNEDSTEQNRLCEKPENVAAICISMRTLYEFRGYDEAMRRASGNPKIKLFKTETAPKETLEAFSNLNAKADFIRGEVGDLDVDSDDGLGTALRVLYDTHDYYNEFMTAYSMHLDNDRLIQSLEGYNQKLAELRTQTYTLPAKFHNATTSGGECT